MHLTFWLWYCPCSYPRSAGNDAISVFVAFVSHWPRLRALGGRCAPLGHHGPLPLALGRTTCGLRSAQPYHLGSLATSVDEGGVADINSVQAPNVSRLASGPFTPAMLNSSVYAFLEKAEEVSLGISPKRMRALTEATPEIDDDKFMAEMSQLRDDSHVE